ncbi:MAG: primosomal protein N' [Parcubacteria group bacterium]|nr:primosomal protein N' [Parcubacteria group bacterium]
MVILSVAPYQNIPLPHPQLLRYYAHEDLPRGSLVEISLRKRKIPAIVFSVSRVQDLKMTLRSASFSVKPIHRVLRPFPIAYDLDLDRALWLHETYWVSLGVALRHVIPMRRIPKTPEEPPQKTPSAVQSREPSLLIGKRRWDEYARAMRQAIDMGKTVLFLVPHRESVSQIHKAHGELFPLRPLYVSSDLPLKKLRAIWDALRNHKHHILIGTRGLIFAPARKLGLIIVEQEEHPQHRSWGERPYYDVRTVARYRQREEGCAVIFGTDLPSVDEYVYAQSSHRTELPDRADIPISCVDMRRERRDGEYTPLSLFLAQKIGAARPGQRQMLLFLNRRGYASSLVCRDCGFVLVCEQCSAPMVYHRIRRMNVSEPRMLCHHCGYERAPTDLCPTCGGHRVQLFGVGIEQVLRACRHVNPSLRIARLDSDSVSSPRQVTTIIRAWNKKKIDVLIGTQLMLQPDLSAAHSVGIVSIDGMLHLPDYAQGEQAWRMLHALRRKAARDMIIQTHVPHHPVFAAFAQNPAHFYEAEYSLRKQFRYPPFAQITKLTIEHRDPRRGYREAKLLASNLSQLLRQLPQTLDVQILGPAPAFIARVKGLYRWNVLIKFPKSLPLLNPSELKMRNALLSCAAPPWSVEVDPITLL